MNIEIQASNVKVDDRLNGLIQKKVQKLEQFYDRIFSAIIYLHNNGVNSKEVEIKINVKSNTLFCKEKAESIEKALDASVEAMRRRLIRYKEKIARQ